MAEPEQAAEQLEQLAIDDDAPAAPEAPAK
jgi:hypothetical protein